MVVKTVDTTRYCCLCGTIMKDKKYIAYHGRLDKREERFDTCDTCYEKEMKRMKNKRKRMLKEKGIG